MGVPVKRSGLKANKPLKRTGYLRRTGRLNAVSEKRQDYIDELEVMRPLVYDRAGGMCECGRGCGNRGEVVHHVIRRSQGGSNLIANLRLLAYDCHQWVHDHPTQARAIGLLESRSDSPADGF